MTTADPAIDKEIHKWINNGNMLVESGMYNDAIMSYDKALEIDPKLTDVLNNKALALARTGRYEDAVHCYEEALKIKPDDDEVLYNKGIALAVLGKTSEAIACYDKIIEKNPGDGSAWCSKGDVYFESGKYEEALHEYDRSIEINPNDETVWNNKGLTLVKLSRLSEAIESYDKALELNPTVEKIWSNKGLALAKMKQTGESIDLQKIAATLQKEEAETKTAIPEHEIIASIPTSEVQELQSIVPILSEDAPEKPVLLNVIPATDYFIPDSEKYDKALNCNEKVPDIDPDDYISLNNKGSALYKMGDFKTALKTFGLAFEKNPENITSIVGMELCIKSLKQIMK